MDLKKLSKNQKIALAVGAVVLMYLVYRWQTSSGSSLTGSTATGSTSTTTPDQSSADYASLAGQEQSDVAALQQQDAQLQAQEQSDVGDLSSQIAGIGGGGGVVSGGGGSGTDTGSTAPTATTPATPVNFDPSAFANAIAQGISQGIQADVPGIASGQTKVSRTQASVAVRPGSAFAKYYQRITGHRPPARVQASNAIYQLFQAGARVPTAHPSAPKQTKVAHPNGNHAQKSNVSHALPKARPRPPAHRPAPPARRK